MMLDDDVVHEDTRFGFIYGAAHVERMFSHKGAVAIWIGTGSVYKGGHGIEVSVSPKGRSIRVFRDGVELTPDHALCAVQEQEPSDD